MEWIIIPRVALRQAFLLRGELLRRIPILRVEATVADVALVRGRVALRGNLCSKRGISVLQTTTPAFLRAVRTGSACIEELSHARTDNGESVGYEFPIEIRRFVEDPVPVGRFHGG